MKVLITGANGMLGQDVHPIFEKAGYEVIKKGHSALDITDEKAVNKAIQELKPDYIIHCAAYTNVDKAESDYENAYKINVEGTKNIAAAAEKCNATMVYISTDYVFDGTKNIPYLPDDAPNPINAYGKTKYLGEMEVQKHCKKYYIARTSWLYGIYGKNFVETMLVLAQKNSQLKVVNDQTGSPTWTVELANGVLNLIKNKEFGIYHLSGKNSATWYDFAKEIFKIENINVNLTPCTTEEFPRDAKRPKYSYMDNGGLLRDWKSALKDYLELRKEVK